MTKNDLKSSKGSRLFSMLPALIIGVLSFGISSSALAQVLVPFSGSNTVSCGTNTQLQDHGGLLNYGNGANGFTVLEASGSAVINISGSYSTETCCDFIRIYDGTGTGGTLLQTYPGSGTANFTGSPGQTLTVQFTSDGSVTSSGFDFTVSYSGACAVVSEVVPFSGSNTVACGTNVQLTDHAGPAANYSNFADGFTVLEAANNAVINIAGSYTTEGCCDFIRVYDGVGTGGTLLATYNGFGAANYTGNPGQTLTVSFTSDVSVTSTGFDFAVTYTGDCVAAPVTEVVPFSGSNIVACGTNVLLSDHSGPGVNYSNSANGFTVLEASGSTVINISGTYSTESCCDRVRIYDGVGIGGALLVTYNGTGVANYTGAPGQTLTVEFTSDFSVTDAGFDFAVTYTGECVTSPPPGGCDLTFDISSPSWGDGTTWTVTDNDGNPVLSGGPYGNGYSDSQTLTGANNGPYTWTIVSTLGDNSPSYTVSSGATVLFTGAVPPATTENVGPITCPTVPPPSCDLTFDISSASWGDGTTWTVTDNDGNPVLSGGPYGNGYSDSQTLTGANNGPYTWTIVSTLSDNSPNYTVSSGATVLFSGNVPPATNVNVGPITCPTAPPSGDCGTTVYDEGGPAGNYNALSDVTETFCPDSPAEILTVTFNSFIVESGWDALYIHDGASTADPLFDSGNPATGGGFPAGGWYGTTNPGPFSASVPGGCITFNFRSDSSVNQAGWEADITCFVPVCGTTVYDEGGPSGTYNANSDVTETYCADTPGDILTITFVSFQVESSWDALYIHDGATTADPLFDSGNPATSGGFPAGGWYGTTNPGPFSSTNPAGCLTLNFRSDSSVNQAGWEANLTCAPPPACDAPTLTDSSVDDCLAGTFDLFLEIGADGDATDYDVFIVGEPGPDCGVSQGAGNPGFPEDPTCEAAVCGDDPFCCDTSWDGICAGLAVADFAAQCAGCLGGVPGTNTYVGTFTGGTTGIAIGTGFTIGEDVTILVVHNDDPACNQTITVTNSQEVCGCNDPAANNFDPAATANDGSCIFPPANDECLGAGAIACGATISASTADANPEPGLGTCVTGLTTAPGVWYEIAGIDGQMFADLCGSSYDTKLGIFSGSCGALVCVTGNDDDAGLGGTGACGGGLQSSTSWFATSSETYYIYVTGFSSASGDFTLNTGCIPYPANNDCVDGQNLPVPAWPASTNSLGSVYGATDSGSSACAAATGGDVFYSFTATSTNHHIVTVNPFGGFDAVVQVLDACGGTEVACFNNAGAGAVETELLLDLPAGDYVVRVQNAAGTFGLGEAALGNFLIGVQSFPTAQVQDNPANILYACNQSGFQLEDIIGATPQTTPWVLDYEWLIAEVGAGTSNIWQRGEPNYSAIINWLGMEYGKLYNVYVRVLVDHPVFGPTWGVFQVDGPNPNAPGASVCTVEMSSNVTPTELRPNYTPTNAQGNFYRLCDLAVAFNVYEAEDFRWRFDPDTDPLNGNEIIYQRNAPNPGVRLSWVGGLIPGNTYNVAVEVQVGGDWSGYSTVLPITLALPPNDVEVRSQYCGITYPSASGVILAQSVCAADNYEWEFDGPTLSTATTGNYALNIGAASVQPPLQPGVYNVRVKVTQEGIPGDFGPVCVITIGGPGAPGDAPSALRELAENSATLFPNPNAGDEVRMELDGLSDGNHEVMIQIYDSYGKLIQTEGFGHTGTNLSRVVRFNSELATGMYLVQIAVDGERYATERLIVK